MRARHGDARHERVGGISTTMVPGVVVSPLLGQPRTVQVPGFELPETAVPERERWSFGRTFDSLLPRPLQAAWVGIDGAVRAAFDVLIPEEGATPAATQVRGPLERARESQRALVDEHALLGNPDRLRAEATPVWRTEAWPLGQVLHGRILLAMQGGDWARVDGIFRELESYRVNDGFVGGIGSGDRYYDDNAWIGLAAMQAHAATGDERYLAHAERTFRQVRSGQHADGGLYWFEQDRVGRHTCSIAPAAQLALRLHEATGSEQYLEFAKEQAAWLNANLRMESGLYADNVSDSGTLTEWVFSYNQGTPIGLDVQLYHATGEQRYLERAQATADAAIRHYGEADDTDRLWKQPPVFNAIFFRNLLALDAAAPDPRITALLDRYLERAWNEGRSAETGLFTEGGIGHYGDHAGTTIDQGALSQLYAIRALPREQWASLT